MKRRVYVVVGRYDFDSSSILGVYWTLSDAEMHMARELAEGSYDHLSVEMWEVQ